MLTPNYAASDPLSIAPSKYVRSRLLKANVSQAYATLEAMLVFSQFLACLLYLERADYMPPHL